MIGLMSRNWSGNCAAEAAPGASSHKILCRGVDKRRRCTSYNSRRSASGYAVNALRKLTTTLCGFILLYTFVSPASAAIATVTSNIENGGTHTFEWTSSDIAVVQRFKTGGFPKYEIENIWIVHKKKDDGTCPIFQLWIWTTPDASTRETIGLAVGVDTDVVDRGTEDCVRKYRVKKNNGPDYSPLLLPGNTDYYMALALKDPYDARRSIKVSLTTWTGSDTNRHWEQDNEIGTGNTTTGTITFRAKNSGALRFRIEETVNTPPQFVGESNKDLGFSSSASEKYSCGIAKGLALQTAPWEITVREHLATGDRLCNVHVYDANKGDKLTLSVSEGYFWVFGDLVYGSSRDSERTVDLDRSKSTNLSVHGELVIRKPFDYEDPAFTDNVRFITFTVFDGRHTVTQTLTVKLVDEPDFPEDFYYSPIITPSDLKRVGIWPVKMEWVSPWNPSRPDVTHYNVRYRKDETNDAWKYIKGIVGNQILPTNDEKRAQIAKFDHHNYLNKDYGFHVYEKTIDFEGLEKNTAYRLEIQAVNPSGTNKWSQERNYTVFTTPATTRNIKVSNDSFPYNFKSPPVVELEGTRNGGVWPAEIKWVSPPHIITNVAGTFDLRPYITHYNIRYRKNGSTDTWTVITNVVGTQITDGNEIVRLNTAGVSEDRGIKAFKHAVDMSLDANTEYKLEIQAVNSKGPNPGNTFADGTTPNPDLTTALFSSQYSGHSNTFHVVFTTPTAPAETSTQIEPNPLSAEIGNLSVTRHDGSPFTFDLTFSKHIPDLSFRTLRDHAFTVTNATITGVRRLEPGKNQKWQVTVNPTGIADVEITLPITADCNAKGAICDGDQPLSTTSAIIVPGPAPEPEPEPEPEPAALTAQFRSVPVEHDGRTAFSFELHFSENVPDLSFSTLRDSAFAVTNGRVTGVRRLAQGSNRRWAVNVQPSAAETVTVHLPASTDCADAGAICLPGGRKLSSALAVTILGPPVASVADATAQEGADATLDFVVTLNRATNKAVTVDYATSDATATAGSDYTATRGTLTFAPGETTKTVPVPVLDDAHDEGEETFTLTLSNASGARISDSSATGTIENADPMPQAWLARFGRTSADHVVEAIAGRWRDGEGQTPQTHFTLGGRQVQDMNSLFGGRDAAFNPADTGNPVLEDESAWARMDRPGTESLADGGPAGSGLSGGSLSSSSPAGHSPADSGTTGGRAARSALMNSLGLPAGGLRDLLMGSSFFYSRPPDEHGEQPGWLGQWSAWGQTAATRFSGADGKLSLNGEVATAILGADSRWDRWVAGVTLARSEGEGAYTHPQAAGGGVRSTLTSLNPYVHFRLSERTNLWGVLGYGVGGLTLTPDKAEAGIETTLATTMAAFGGRGVLSVRPGRGGAFELAIVSDALVTNTVSEATENLMGAAGQASRLRLMLEGSGLMPLAGGVLRPTLEAGLRYDSGDAETGAGLEVGAGMAYAAGQLEMEVKARVLIAHQDTEYEEWGLSGSIRYQPRSDGRGLSMQLGSAWGATQSGVQSMWSSQDAGGLARGAAMNAGQRFQAELGYGFSGRGHADALWMPFLGAETAGGAQSLRMGFRLTSGPNVEMGLELGRRENGRDEPENAIQLAGSIRW